VDPRYVDKLVKENNDPGAGYDYMIGNLRLRAVKEVAGKWPVHETFPLGTGHNC
jgi:hypothetical protein